MHITKTDILTSLRESTLLALLGVTALFGAYIVVEPTVSSAVEDQFEITQTITAEIAFLTTANDVTMSPTIPGITGGTANGGTQVVVQTNNAAGYSMTIEASSSPAMQGDTSSDVIQDYTPGTAGVPDYAHSVGANTGEFAYTLSASTTSDLAQKFLDNGADTCNTGSNDTDGSDSCWYGLSTTATSTINRTTATAASGATTTLFFRTQITSNPSPAIGQDTYTATTTLTATTN